MGGAIGHILENQFHPIAYSSKILSAAERNYPTFKRELLAIKTFVAHWRFYTIGKPFVVTVDHKPITEEKFLRKTNCKVLLSWILELEEYDFEIRYKKGIDMGLADGLSRLPNTRDKLYEWWETNFSTNGAQVKTKNARDFTEFDMDFGEVLEVAVNDSGTNRGACNDTVTQESVQKDQKEVQEIPEQVHEDPEQVLDSPEPVQNPQLSQRGSFDNPIIDFNDAQGKWKDLQKCDPNLQKAISWVTAGEFPKKSESASLNNELRKLLSKRSMLHVHNGLLCYKWLCNKTKKYKLLIWVPAGQRMITMKNLHDIEASGHLGPTKTLERIRQKLYWPDMRLEVTLYCQTCSACFVPNQAYKANPKAGLKPFTSARHNQIVALDLIGPISRVNKYKWCLTMIDKFTHYLEVDPLEDATSPTIARSIVDTWVTKHGVMEELLTDQGSNIDRSKVIKELYNTLQVGKIRTTPYKSSTNGLAEAANKQIKVCLTKYVLDNPDSWPEKLKIIAFAYNTSQNKATAYTPFFLVHGREARVPNDLVFGTTSSEYYATQAHLASKTYYTLKQAWDQALTNIGNLQKQQKRYYDKTAKLTSYSVGDRVLLHYNRPKKGTELNKFKPPYIGPFKVTKVLDVNLELEEEKTGNRRIVHVDRARRIPKGLRVENEDQSPKDIAETSKEITNDSSDDDDHQLRQVQKTVGAPMDQPGGNLDYLERMIEAEEMSNVDEEQSESDIASLEENDDSPEGFGEPQNTASSGNRVLRDRTKIQKPTKYRNV